MVPFIILISRYFTYAHTHTHTHTHTHQVLNMSRPLTGAARQAFGSFVRAYATHSMDTKGIFRVQVKTISSSALPCAPLSSSILSCHLLSFPLSCSDLFSLTLALPCLALPCFSLALACFVLSKLASLHLIIQIASYPTPSYPPIVSYPVLSCSQSLHLGHVAKCFGLRDSPKTIRVHDDTISKIFNGLYSAALFNDKEAKKRARDEKFSLSRGVKKAAQAAKPAQSGGNKWRGGSTDSNISKTSSSSSAAAAADSADGNGQSVSKGGKGDGKGKDSVTSSSSSSSSMTTVRRSNTSATLPEERMTNTSKPIPIIIPSDKRKLRMGTKASTMGSRVLAPSGKFRKSADGYFKKKLRNQSSSEFSA